jgi:hypothetical protein
VHRLMLQPDQHGVRLAGRARDGTGANGQSVVALAGAVAQVDNLDPGTGRVVPVRQGAFLAPSAQRCGSTLSLDHLHVNVVVAVSRGRTHLEKKLKMLNINKRKRKNKIISQNIFPLVRLFVHGKIKIKSKIQILFKNILSYKNVENRRKRKKKFRLFVRGIFKIRKKEPTIK